MPRVLNIKLDGVSPGAVYTGPAMPDLWLPASKSANPIGSAWSAGARRARHGDVMLRLANQTDVNLESVELEAKGKL
jgi:hypothetical protein